MTTANLWSEVLKLLQLQTTKATYQAWLKNTTAQEEEGHLIVLTPSAFGQDWLDNRLRHTIELAVEAVFGRKIPVEFRVVANGSYQPDLFLTGTYRDAYNAIVQPDKQHYCSRYFHQKWLPLLGPERWLLIWQMRTHCYWNKETGVKRDTFDATLDELGAAMGMDRTKVWRLLHPKDEVMKSYLAKFILKSSTKRRYSKGRGGMVNDTTTWQIRLDDPLTPEDEERLKGMI